FSPQLGTAELNALRRAGVRFVLVDKRLSTMLPLTGYYYERGEPESRQHAEPISLSALTKFETAKDFKRIFDSGNIIIYAVGDVSNTRTLVAPPSLNAREAAALKSGQPTMMLGWKFLRELLAREGSASTR
ncbi:MAG: hypothetical protein LC737_00370, partial [Chloroflexi bacterium]|nr:hypothetical protein [Chloroflexota bacterium]